MKLAGVIYLHEISQPRMMGTPRKNLEMFRELCGEAAIKNVVLATTKWDDVAEEVGLRREQQLIKDYWGNMLTLGSTMLRSHINSDSAWEIVNHILGNHSVDTLQIQEELVDKQQILPETAAGRALRATLKELLAIQEKTAEKLKQSSSAQGDSRLKQTFEQNQKEIKSILHQIRELEIPFSRRVLNMMRFRSVRS